MTKKTILVVEDDEFFRDILEKILKSCGFEVNVAQNGKVAQQIIKLQSFDAIISDIRMPKMDGIALLSWVKREDLGVPFILMTGFSEILETQEGFKLGADGFLAKPFEQVDLLNTLDGFWKKEEASEPEPEKSVDDQYGRVAIDDFISGTKIPYNIFIRLSDTKYTKVAHRGADVSLDRIKSYKEKGVSHFYLRKIDFESYLSACLDINEKLALSSSISTERKVAFLRHAGEVILEKAFIDGVDTQNFNQARSFLHSSLSVLSNDDQSINLLESLNLHADFVYAHSLGVALYSVMIAQKLGWKSTSTNFKVGIAGLFHDIGKKEIDRVLLETPRVNQSQEQRKFFESHATRGAEILNTVKSLPLEITQVALQHHEESTGYGYPNGLAAGNINSLSKLISVANVFCNYAIKGPDSQGMGGKQALEQAVQFRKDSLDQEYLQALADLFQFKLESWRAA